MYPRTIASTGNTCALRTQIALPSSWSEYACTSSGISLILAVITWFGMCLVSGALERRSKKNRDSAVRSLPLFGMPCNRK
jgi:hypothetical protein